MLRWTVILAGPCTVTRVKSVEMVRLVNGGTEATMSAIRLARAHTGIHTNDDLSTGVLDTYVQRRRSALLRIIQ